MAPWSRAASGRGLASRPWGAGLAALVVTQTLAAQEPPPTFRAESQVVVLDVVARDGRDRPIADLRQDEIQVFEDGTRCEIVSVRLVQAASVKVPAEHAKGASTSDPVAGAPGGTAATPARSSLVVLVFDQLSLEPARRAREAASQFASGRFPADTWFAVAKIGQGVRLLQTFTSTTVDLPGAIEAATMGSDATRDAALSPGFDSVTEQALGAGPVNGSNIRPDQMSVLDVIKQGFAKSFDLARRTQQGHASIAPLRAIVKGLEPVQGRKTLVYFSEGLHLPPDVQAAYDTLVSEANRANVTVYSLDTRGLTVRSPTENSRLRLQPSPLAPGRDDPLESAKPVAERDQLQDGLQGLNVQANMESLALATGGFLIGNSKLLSALEAPTPRRDFEQLARVLHFGPGGAERDALLLLEVPLAKVQLSRDQAQKVYRAHLSLVALIKDEGGRLVTRVSHDWPLEGPLDQAVGAAKGSVTFRRSLRLPPGGYRLEAGVQDRESGGISVERYSFAVPPAGPSLALSSLTLLKRSEEAPAVSAEAVAADPLRVATVVLVPDLDATLALGTRDASFFLRAYSAGPEPIKAKVAVRRGDEIVGQSELALPPRDDTGQVAWVGSLNASSFAAGGYELSVSVRQGTEEAEERVPFRIDAPPGSPIAAANSASAAPPSDPALATLLERAGQYVSDYEQTFKGLVAEEEYIQWETDGARSTRRLLRSDLVFASMPGPIPWTCFRDVYKVDGQNVREREARLEKLFVQGTPSAVAKADAIRKESSRYNIGTAVRNINVPTLALLFLHPRNQVRFRFERKGQRWFSGTPGTEVAFTEIVEPSLVNDGRDDLPGQGRFWIDANRGTILRSEVTYRFTPDRAFAKISVEYRPEPGLNIWVPAEMKERYEDLPGAWTPVFGTKTEGTARYSNYRRFSVSTQEKATVPEP
jgi:VWFA-related protein